MAFRCGQGDFAAAVGTKTESRIMTRDDTASTFHQASAASEVATTAPCQAVFDNPQEFLSVLKRDYDQITAHSNGQMTFDALESYSKIGADPAGRQAAEIAADHFSDMLAMSQLPDYYLGCFAQRAEADAVPAISKQALNAESDLYDGRYGWYVADRLPVGAAAMAGNAALTVFAGIGSLSLGMGGVLLLPILAKSAIGTFVSGYGTLSLYRQFRNLSQFDNKTLQSWPEINGSMRISELTPPSFAPDRRALRS